MRTLANNQLVTIYINGGFGNIVKYEGKLIEYGNRKYAQYDNASFASFVPKGKRKAVGFIKTSHSTMLILPGYNHPEPDSMFGEAKIDENGTSIRESRYMSFDSRFATDFDAKIDGYLANNNIKPLLDCRTSKGFSPYTPESPMRPENLRINEQALR